MLLMRFAVRSLPHRRKSEQSLSCRLQLNLVLFAVVYHVDPNTPTPPRLLCVHRSAVCRPPPTPNPGCNSAANLSPHGSWDSKLWHSSGAFRSSAERLCPARGSVPAVLQRKSAPSPTLHYDKSRQAGKAAVPLAQHSTASPPPCSSTLLRTHTTQTPNNTEPCDPPSACGTTV